MSSSTLWSFVGGTFSNETRGREYHILKVNVRQSTSAPWLEAFTSTITTMPSPRTLASRSAIITLLACALAVASAAPGVVEPTTGISSDVFNNIRTQTSV